MPVTLPRNLAHAALHDGRQAWLAALPTKVEALRERWSLALGEAFQPGGTTAWVAPASAGDDRELVLKVAWRHPEAEHEADGLREWDGEGAVRLHAAEHVDDDTTALLLERCMPGTALMDRPEPEQDIVVAGLLRRLWRQPEAGHPLRPLQSMCDLWADEADQGGWGACTNGLDPGLVREGIALLRLLPATADRSVLLCTDLHAGNILAARREPWLAIDPKPYVGDPAYDVVQHLLNCDQRLAADPLRLARRMADLVEVDHERVRLWLFARCVMEGPERHDLAEIVSRLAPH